MKNSNLSYFFAISKNIIFVWGLETFNVIQYDVYFIYTMKFANATFTEKLIQLTLLKYTLYSDINNIS